MSSTHYKQILKQIDLRKLENLHSKPDELKQYVQQMIDQVSLNDHESHLKDLWLSEILGLGPLDTFFSNPDITEVMINSFDHIYIEKMGCLEKSNLTFSCEEALRSILNKLVSPTGRRVDESSPMVDARLPDGSRLNGVISPVALNGTCITIRKFSKQMKHAKDLIERGSVSSNCFEFLKMSVSKKKNILIAGGTGTGKTTILNILSNFIGRQERIITIEDAAELQLGQEHVIRLESRPSNIEGKGQINIRDLLKNALRMRPDRIIVGECRGSETIDMLSAMNTGHEGSMSTVHANSARDALFRIENMILMSGIELPLRAIRDQVVSAIDLIVFLKRLNNGSRVIYSVTEVCNVESDTITLKDIFLFDPTRSMVSSTKQVPNFVLSEGWLNDHKLTEWFQ